MRVWEPAVSDRYNRGRDASGPSWQRLPEPPVFGGSEDGCPIGMPGELPLSSLQEELVLLKLGHL